MGNTFRTTLMGVAEQAFRDRDIDRRELLRLRLATAIPSVARQLEEECCRQGQAVGVIHASAGTNAAIDWSTLAEFLKEILPTILEFIKLIVAVF